MFNSTNPGTLSQGSQKEKDEDSVSQVSTSSQLSDDLNLTSTPNNTPVVLDSPLAAIKRADEVLKMIENFKLEEAKSVGSDKDVTLVAGGEQTSTGNAIMSKSLSETFDTLNCVETSTAEENPASSQLDDELTRNNSLSESDQHMAPVNTGASLDQPASQLSLQPDGGDQEGGPKEIRSKLSYHISLTDALNEIAAIEATDPFRKGYKKDKSTDDFYSIFLDTSPESPEFPVTKSPKKPAGPSVLAADNERYTEMQDIAQRRLANSWSEYTAPTNIYSLVVSTSHVWFTDKAENIHYSTIGSPKGILWRKATGNASQISVSPSGHIVWRLHRGTVYAGTKISSRHPEGLKWVEAVKDVEYISVDDHCVW